MRVRFQACLLHRGDYSLASSTNFRGIELEACDRAIRRVLLRQLSCYKSNLPTISRCGHFYITCEQALRGDLVAGREKEGELVTTSQEFEFLPRKSRCKMLIVEI